jgi:cytidyltransferase-like protein
MIQKKEKKVLLFGTFSGIHKGHINLFKQAKKYGTYLTVVVARDKTVKKVKKKLPLRNEGERLRALKKYSIINEIKLGHKDNPYRIIKEIKPDVICLGYDQKVFTKDLKKQLLKMRLKTKICRLKPYKPGKYHSAIMEKNYVRY